MWETDPVDFPAVEAQLNDLPSTFTRPAGWYPQLIDAIASSLSLYTQGEDAELTQIATFGNAVNGWLDIWGLLFGIPRNANEADQAYEIRIQRLISAWVATVPAVQTWMNFYAVGGSVTENVPGPGYTLLFPGSVTIAQIQDFLTSFNRIRPIGVPFLLEQAGLGLYLGTDEFLGDGRVAGNYLTALGTPVFLSMAASTPNAVPLLPTLLLTDPTLNP